MAQSHTPSPLPNPTTAPAPSPSTQSQSPTNPESQSAFSSQRSRRQLGLFAAGAGFFAISSFITRRSLVRRYKMTIPKFYQPNNQPVEFNGAMEAFEALNIATINVLSVGMMATGGLLWALDISSMDDMRRKVRSNRVVRAGSDDKEAEKEIEELVATLLARKEFKVLLGQEKEREKGKEQQGQSKDGEDQNSKDG